MSEDNHTSDAENTAPPKTAFPKRKRVRTNVTVDAPSRSHRSQSQRGARRRALTPQEGIDAFPAPEQRSLTDSEVTPEVDNAQLPTQSLAQVTPPEEPIETTSTRPVFKPLRPTPTPKPTVEAEGAPSPAIDTAEVSPAAAQKPARRKSKVGRTLMRLGILVVVLAAVVLLAYWALTALGLGSFFEQKDYSGPGSGEVVITVPEGATGRDIAQILVDAEVVKTTDAFVNAFNEDPQASKIQAGTYKLMKHMKASEALSALLDSHNLIGSGIEVQPGMTVKQVLSQLSQKGNFSQQKVADAAKDTAALGLPEVAKGNLEGWLAPGTYLVNPGDTPTSILKKMVDRMKDLLADENVPLDQAQTILIKASIAEKEVASKDYYGKVVTVINNRLEPGNETAGFLGMDSTIQYGLGKESGHLTQAEIDKDTPYNTRLHKGLPPGPISCVGKDALDAALHPEPGDWLYFVTVNFDTGETLFSNNSTDFEKDVALLHQYCDQNPEKCK